MAEEKMMDDVDVKVMIGDVALYAKEHKCSLDDAYESIGVPSEERMTAIEIMELLYPKDDPEKSLEQLIKEHFDDLLSCSVL